MSISIDNKLNKPKVVNIEDDKKDFLILSLMKGIVDSMLDSDMTERLTDKIIGNNAFIGNLFMSYISEKGKKESVNFVRYLFQSFINEEIENKQTSLLKDKKNLDFLSTDNHWLSDFDANRFRAFMTKDFEFVKSAITSGIRKDLTLHDSFGKQGHMCRSILVTVEDGEELLNFAKNIKRSSGYMDKRAYAICLAIENCILNDDYAEFCASNLSVRYRGLVGIVALKKRRTLKLDINKNQNIADKDKLSHLKSQINNLSMIFYSCLKEFSWGEFSLLDVENDLEKSDIPFLMPVLSSHSGYYGRNLKDWVNNKLMEK
jgi:predicted nucleic acid-binding protein